MRARELLFEDSRSTIEKLEELIAHPGTEETVRKVAQSRLQILRANNPQPVAPRSRITVETNIIEEHLDQQWLVGVTLGEIYEGLCNLAPAPNKIHFLRQGQIQMMVPPPMMGKTRQEYYEEITRVCPGIKNISARMVEGQGYYFVISYI